MIEGGTLTSLGHNVGNNSGTLDGGVVDVGSLEDNGDEIGVEEGSSKSACRRFAWEALTESSMNLGVSCNNGSTVGLSRRCLALTVTMIAIVARTIKSPEFRRRHQESSRGCSS